MSWQLSGIVSCDSDAIRIRIRIVRCQRPAKRQKHKPCETQGRLFFAILLVGSKESVLKVPKTQAISRCDSCDKKTLRFVCPSCTRDTDGIAAKLLRCGIASEALRRNMPLSMADSAARSFGEMCYHGKLLCVRDWQPSFRSLPRSAHDVFLEEICDRGELPSGHKSNTGKKKSPNTNLWSGYLPVEWGSSTWRGRGQKVRYVPRDQGNQTFWRDILGFAGIFRGSPKSLRKTNCVLFLSPTNMQHLFRGIISPNQRSYKLQVPFIC